MVVSGSHKALEKYYHALTPEQKKMKHGDQRQHFKKIHPYFQEMMGMNENDYKETAWFMNKERNFDGVGLQVVELTGSPGDVVFCHPRIIHAPAGINKTKHPRFMSNSINNLENRSFLRATYASISCHHVYRPCGLHSRNGSR